MSNNTPVLPEFIVKDPRLSKRDLEILAEVADINKGGSCYRISPNQKTYLSDQRRIKKLMLLGFLTGKGYFATQKEFSLFTSWTWPHP